MDDESWKIRAIILRKLLKFGKIGGAHTEARNAVKGFPSDKIGHAKKEVEWLVKKNYLLCKPSTGEAHVSVNPNMLSEIKTLLLNYFKIEEL